MVVITFLGCNVCACVCVCACSYVISVGGLEADKAYRYKAKVSCESCMHILTQK